MTGKWLTVLTEQTVWEAEFASALVRIPPTVAGEHLVVSGGLWGLCPVVSELKQALGQDEDLEGPPYLVAVVVSHDHVHHSLHEGLEHIRVEVLDGPHKWLECLTEPKSCDTWHERAGGGELKVFNWHEPSLSSLGGLVQEQLEIISIPTDHVRGSHLSHLENLRTEAKPPHCGRRKGPLKLGRREQLRARGSCNRVGVMYYDGRMVCMLWYLMVWQVLCYW